MLDEHNFEEWYEILMRSLLRDVELFTWFCVPPYTDPDFETEPYEHFDAVDADGVHVPTVIAKWRGESGKIKWRNLLHANDDRKIRWTTSLSDIVVKVARHVRNDLWDRVKLTAEYVEGMNDRPIGVKKIIGAVKKIATGHGAHSLYLDLTKLFECKMKDGQWVLYFKEFRSARGRIKNRPESAEEILEAIFDTIFVKGVIDQPKLKDQIAQVLSKTKWPSADTNMAEWSVTLETLQGIKKGSNHEGKLIANAARPVTGSSRIPRGPPPIAKTTKTGGSRTITCWGCGKEGHHVSDCMEEPSECRTCGETHHSSQHDNVAAAKMKLRKSTFKKPPHPKSPAARKFGSTPKSTKATAYSVGSNEGDSDDDLQLASLTLLYGNSARHGECEDAEFAAALDDSLFGEDVTYDGAEEINANTAMMAFASQTSDVFGAAHRTNKTPTRRQRFRQLYSDDEEDEVIEVHSSVHFVMSNDTEEESAPIQESAP